MTQVVQTLMGLAMALAIPALIALLAPRRWRWWALLGWAATPAVVLVLMAAAELASGRAGPRGFDNLLFGILLIGSFLLLPWLLVCGVGFAIGAALRGRGPPRPAAAPARPAPQPAMAASQPMAEAPVGEPYVPRPPDPDAPSLSPRSGWQAAHVGFDHDDLVLDGLAVWSLPWREEAGAGVRLAHPAHPGQLHDFTVYNVDDGTRATRFAAAELSNGVWGFYRWIVPADAARGESADGRLRYEHDLGPLAGGRHDAVAACARLFDARSGRELFEGSAWQESRIVPQADGSLLLTLAQRELQTIFRIDPAAGAFRDLSVVERARPLAELAGAAAAARAACDDPANAYLSRRVAPDGSLLVELQAVEWSNTHWVRSPRVTEIATGRVVLDLWGTDWDAWPEFPRRRTVRMAFRRYRFGGDVDVELDLAGERYVLFERGGATTGPLSEVRPAMEAASRRSLEEGPHGSPLARPRVTLRSWFVALLILAGTLALIAGATRVTLRLQGEPPPQRLDVIPPMPGPPAERPRWP